MNDVNLGLIDSRRLARGNLSNQHGEPGTRLRVSH
jgi:hypothetical protein